MTPHNEIWTPDSGRREAAASSSEANEYVASVRAVQLKIEGLESGYMAVVIMTVGLAGDGGDIELPVELTPRQALDVAQQLISFAEYGPTMTAVATERHQRGESPESIMEALARVSQHRAALTRMDDELDRGSDPDTAAELAAAQMLSRPN